MSTRKVIFTIFIHSAIAFDSFSEVHASSNEQCFEQSLPSKALSSLTSVKNHKACDSKQLDQLIDKFRSCVEVHVCFMYFVANFYFLKIQDIRASEIMGIYEHKLQTMMVYAIV